MRNTYKIRDIGNGLRCHWVYDEDHETRGRYDYDTEAETRAAEDEEIAKLESGEWVVLGCIVERLCPTCGTWKDEDSCYGIVIEPDDAKLDEMARWQFGLK